jgi:Mg-chelatase subunit ChlD
VQEGAAAARAVERASRRTTSRRELSRREHFAELSPELGVLDEAALDELVGEDPDEAVALLADLTGATDERLRRLARAAAARVVVDLARRGRRAGAGIGRLERRRFIAAEGDLDLDASLEGIAGARAASEPVRAEDLVVSSWRRPSTALCLLVDRSGSMEGDRLAAAAVAAAAVVSRAGHDCSVVAFAEDAVVLAGQREGRAAERVVEDLLRLRGFGVTDIDLALRVAAGQLARSSAPRRVTLLLSDCRATNGPDPVPAASALDELVVLAPADDDEDARLLATSVGARVVTVAGPASVAEALATALDPTDLALGAT